MPWWGHYHSYGIYIDYSKTSGCSKRQINKGNILFLVNEKSNVQTPLTC